MIKAGKIPDRRRYQRFDYPRRFRGFTGEGDSAEKTKEFEGVIKNISPGGAAVLTQEVLENDQFVDLHIEGVGFVPAQVKRIYDGGCAVEFKIDDEKKSEVQEELDNFRQSMKKQGDKA
ncbi:MAG TPA: PilZ domain-containing protein [Rhodospirillales bacterium]|nr:PilZ domain-containing protein [Rhodospirillales bacterium]